MYPVPNLSVNRSLGALSFWAVWMSRMIFCSVLSAGSRTTSKSSAPQRLRVPLNTLSPVAFSTGVASPVSVDSSLALRPVTTVPSAANASPGLTRTRWSTCSSPTASSRTTPSGSTTVARLGEVLSRALTSRCVRSRAYSSIAPDAEKRNSRSTASPQAPMKTAPTATASIRKWMSIRPFMRFSRVSTTASQAPATRAMPNSTRDSQGRPGMKYCVSAPAIPSNPQTAASTASVRHSWSSGVGSALISGHSISRQSQSFSAVSHDSRPTTVALPSRRSR